MALKGGVRPAGPRDFCAVGARTSAGSVGTEGSLWPPHRTHLTPTFRQQRSREPWRRGQLDLRGFLCLPGLVTLHEGCGSVAVPVRPSGACHCQCRTSWPCPHPSCLQHN